MIILRSIDIEEEVRLALKDYLTVYVRPLPEKFTVPCILVTATGGQTSNQIDTYQVVLDARAKEPEEASELLRTAQGLLEKQADVQFGALRHATFSNLLNWGTDPVRKDLKLCRVTATVTVHKELFEIQEES